MWLDDLNTWVFGFETSLEVFARPKSSNQEDRLNTVSFQRRRLAFDCTDLDIICFRVPLLQSFVLHPLNLLLDEPLNIYDEGVKYCFDILPAKNSVSNR
jgi:hypothetical protein